MDTKVLAYVLREDAAKNYIRILQGWTAVAVDLFPLRPDEGPHYVPATSIRAPRDR